MSLFFVLKVIRTMEMTWPGLGLHLESVLLGDVTFMMGEFGFAVLVSRLTYIDSVGFYGQCCYCR